MGRLLNRVAAFLAGALCILLITSSSFAASVIPDATDYAPGDTVFITGAGFASGETVRVQVTHVDTTVIGLGHEPWDVTADGAGGFFAKWFVPYDDNVDEILAIEADGLISFLHAETTIVDDNVDLELTNVYYNDTLCPGGTQFVCATLRQDCGCNSYAPLAGRYVIFFINPNGCGLSVNQNGDSVLTDANGNACYNLTVPTTPGTYTVRVKFNGESKPSTCPYPGNSPCFPYDPDRYKRCTKLSTANDCEPVVVNTAICNRPPVANAGRDTTVLQCTATPISIAAGCSDPDGNLSTCVLISGIGTYSGGYITFTPTGSGTYTFILKATDTFGLTDYDTSVATVTINQAPVANAGRDTTLAQCTPAVINIAAGCTDPDGNLSTCALTTGTGTYSGGYITFTPAGSGTYTFILKATDACGLTDYDTSVATVTINQAPVANAGRDTTLAQCTPAVVNIAAGCTDPDGNLSTCALTTGTGTYSGGYITFTPAGTGTYTFILKATDACGLTDYDTSVATVTLNQPPVANAGRDTTLLQCTAAPISIAAGCTDPDGNLSTCALTTGTGTYSGGYITFTPTGSGTYTFILKATDACGLTDYDTSVATVTINQAPVANAGRDTTLAQCTPAVVNIAAGCTDPDGNLSTCALTTGTGTYSGGYITFTPSGSGTYTFILKATDACGLTDYDTSVATVTINQAPVANAGRDTTLAQCTPAVINIAAACTDPDGNLSTCALTSGTGTYGGGYITFTPSGTGTYTFILKATDACGLTDYDTSVATVTINQAPVANAGRDTTLAQCTSAPISIAAGCTDPDGNLSTCALTSGTGTYSGGYITFTPTGSGTYTFILKATDACGLTDYDTSVATVTINQAPVANAGRDTTLAQCTPAVINIAAGCTDPDGNLTTCALTSGTGTYSGGYITFTPTGSGTYTFILKATDACGLTDYDTSVATVTINQAPVANAGRDTTLAQCTPAIINIAAGCTDPDGNLSTCTLTTGTGTYSGGYITFTPSGSGTYTFILKATDACGLTDYDTSVATVTINQAPVANAGRDTTLAQCTPAIINIAAGCTDPDGNLSTCALTTGTGTYSGGYITFTPTGSGTYTFILKATDACGLTDYDTSVATLTVNQPPVANAGSDQTLTCQTPGQSICWTAGCTDPDGNLSTCQLISGTGTYNSSQICFSPTSNGVYTFVLKATDACGATDYDTSVVTVTVNQAPVANAGRDTTLAQCTAAPISIAAGCTDPDGNLSTCALTSGTGTYSGGYITFTPSGTGTYTFILKATDACGLTDYDTSVATVTINQAPVANAGRDTTLAQCTPAIINIAAGCTDPDGNLSTCTLTTGTGTYSGGYITFTPSGSGTYTFILKATDACGLTDYDTSVATVTINQAPVANAGRDTTLAQCTPAIINIAAGCTDPDGNLSTCALTTGTGTYSGGYITFTPTGSGTYTFILKATDACGLTDYDTSVATLTVNQPPVANAGSDQTLTCQTPGQSICWTAGCTDPDGNLSTCQLISGTGTYNSSQICFSPTSNGVYTFVLKATDACGATDYDTSVVTVTVNQAPVANAGRDTTLAQCTAAPISIAAGCTDPDGNLSTCALTSGTGTYSGGYITFTPSGTGTYTFILKATDACGLTDYDTSVATVTINQAPVANAGRDTTLAQCTSAPISIAAGCTDPDGNLSTCALTSGTGTYSGGYITFTPSGSGTYTFILKATDACGLTDYDTSVATVTVNQAPVANAGRDTTLAQCTAAPISIAAGCTDPDGNLSTCALTTGTGTYSGGYITFTPSGSGTYTFILRATDACGLTDYDTSVATVTINQAPVANAGRDTTLAQCTSAPISIAAGCTDPDGNLSTCALTSGTGTYSGGYITFTPTGSGTYTFILKATDACGLTDYDTSVATVTINQAPVANAGRDTTLAQCTPAVINIAAGCTDPDGNLSTCALTSGTGTYSGGYITFTPTGSGTYTFILKATDACGLTDYDTSVATLTVNQPPVANAGSDQTLTCQAPGQSICWTAGCTDPDGNLSTCQLISGTGTYNSSQICFSPTSNGAYTFVLKATDACGAIDYDTSVVTVTVNQAPVANAGRDSTLLQCIAAPINIAAGCTDPDGNLSTCTLTTGTGTYSGGYITFTPSGSGTYTFILKATDACGLTDYDTSVATVTINQAPVANAGRDTTLAQCTPAVINIAAGCTDPDGNLSTCALTSGTGTYSGGYITFTPTGSGTYTFILKATDACGLTDYDTSVATLTVNQPPVANAGSDQTLTCQTPGQSICWTAGCTDPDGNLSTCQLTSGTGTYNGGQICFSPTSNGAYTFVLKATDACGATDYDTSVVTVTVNQPPVANAGNDQTLTCQAPGQSICWTAGCTDPDGNLSTCQLTSGTGTYNGGQICFSPTSNGAYTFVLKATDACGATDYDTSVVTVTVNQPPVANAGNDQTLTCQAPGQSICWTAGCTDPDGNLSTCQLISGTGTYSSGQICFSPISNGAYTFILKATDACGLTDNDTSVVNITVNQPPAANAGNDQTLTCHTPGQSICWTAGCTDSDGNLSTCQLISGTGTYNGSQICFSPTSNGAYTFVLKATDACGATDYDTSVVTVTVNQAPVANAGSDQTLTCQAPGQSICWTAGCTDPDGNLSTCQLTSGTGTYNGSQICFSPTSNGAYTFILKATDACGLIDYDTSIVSITMNGLPVAFAGRDTTLFQCASSQICIAANCSDADGNLSSCQLVSGTGIYNGSSICFTPATTGTYTFVLKATDACGAIDYDTSIAQVTMNSAPIANAGRDTSVFQCAAAPICIPASCNDADGNLSSCQLVSGVGTYNGSSICFTPTTTGSYTFVLRAVDACGAIDYDTSVATVTLNRPPVADAGRDTTLFQAAPAPISIAAGCTDPDGNLLACELISSPGSYSGGYITFTPTGSGTYMFILKATDACAGVNRAEGSVDYDTSYGFVSINQPPVANAGSDRTLTGQTPGQSICWATSCSDPDNNLSTCQLVSGTGTYSGGQICFNPTSNGAYTFVLKATDIFGATDFDTSVVNIRVNVAPTLTIAERDTTVFCQQTGVRQICVPFSYGDADNNFMQITTDGTVPATVTYNGGSGLLCFDPVTMGGNHSFTLTAVDSCNLQTAVFYNHDVVLVDCDTATCFAVQIAKTHNSLQGHFEFVGVDLSGAGGELGGFDFLIAYDASALTAMEVETGQMLVDCGWEYFTYRFGATGNCDGPCPSGLLRVVAMAETNNGAHHPGCFGPADPTAKEIFVIKFLVTNDRTYDCQYSAVKFYWIDCGDNTISSVHGDTLFIDKQILAFDGQLLWDELNDTQFPNYARLPGIGAADECMLGDKRFPVRCIEFRQGGVDIVCADSIDARGDLNLNGIANEIADAVIYTQFFLFGIDAFPVSGRQAAIAASDINADGTPLTIGDLVYLIRIISGDALPYAKLSPFAQEVDVHFDGRVVATESNVNIGAVLLTFRVGEDFKITNLTSLTLDKSQTAGELKVLLYDISTKSIGSGLRELVSVEGQAELVTAEVADYNGSMMTSRLGQVTLPVTFALDQNYPNPFNPETVIEFALPTTGEVSLRIYNVAGQLVKTLVSGATPAGYYQIRWDGRDASGSDVSSGVYFYRIDANDFSETRKMLLVK